MLIGFALVGLPSLTINRNELTMTNRHQGGLDLVTLESLFHVWARLLPKAMGHGTPPISTI